MRSVIKFLMVAVLGLAVVGAANAHGRVVGVNGVGVVRNGGFYGGRVGGYGYGSNFVGYGGSCYNQAAYVQPVVQYVQPVVQAVLPVQQSYAQVAQTCPQVQQITQAVPYQQSYAAQAYQPFLGADAYSLVGAGVVYPQTYFNSVNVVRHHHHHPHVVPPVVPPVTTTGTAGALGTQKTVRTRR